MIPEKMLTSFDISALVKKTRRPRGQQSLAWGIVSSRYKYKSKLQATFGGIVETTAGFCITKTPYEEFYWHSMALNCEANSPIQLKFERHWDFMCSSCKQVWRRSDWKWTSFFSTTQGHVTPKWFIRSGRNSNLSEILCQSSLPVSLMENEFRVTEKR